jgi:hypothetical protein
VPSGGLQLAQVGEHHRRVGVDVGDLIALGDHAIGPDEVAVALREADLFRAGVAHLVGDADLLGEVGQQPEREVELVAEREVRIRRVEGDAEDLAAEAFEFLGLVTQALALNRSAGGVGHRIPPEQYPAAAEIGEPDGRTVLVDDTVELRGNGSGCEHISSVDASVRRQIEVARVTSPSTSSPAP